VTANELAANAVIAGKVAAGAISTTQLAASAVTADKVSIGQLSAISSNLGTITGGSMSIGGGRFQVAADGSVQIMSASTGQRLVISNSLVQVFDSAGTLRVRMGIW